MPAGAPLLALLLPSWLDRGRGRFLATVSAAGMLTMLGSAPYSVTKHAALSFAEWLSATYRHRGITVQALCPQGVRTAMLTGSGPGAAFLMAASAIEPGEVADVIVTALRATTPATSTAKAKYELEPRTAEACRSRCADLLARHRLYPEIEL